MIVKNNKGTKAKASYRFGELLAMKLYQANGWEVLDQTENEDYWSKDIDFTASKIDVNGNLIRKNIEVKWDSFIYQSGNMFIELLSDIDMKKPGWFMFCQADVLLYGSSEEIIFYQLSLSDLRDYIKRYEGQYNTKSHIDFNSEGQIVKRTFGALVPIVDFSKHYPIKILDATRIIKE